MDHNDRSDKIPDYAGVGSILFDWFDDHDNRKYIVANIRGGTLEEKLTRNRIKNGALKDFSLTHNYELTEHLPTGQMYKTKTPIEVSVCRQGARSKCHILYYFGDKGEATKTSKLYNRGDGDPLRPLGIFKTKISKLVKANSKNMQSPSPSDIPQTIDLLNQITAMKREAAERDAEFARVKQEADDMKAANERQKEEAFQSMSAESDSLIETFLQMNGNQKSDETQQAMQALRAMREDPYTALSSVNTVLRGMVSANSYHKKRADEAGE